MHPETTFDLIAWAATALSSTAALLTQHRARKNATTLSAAVAGLIAAAVCGAAQLVLLFPLSGYFGAIKIVQYHLAVPAAALGLTLAAGSARRRDRLRTYDAAVAVALILPGLVIAHAAFIAPYRLTVERVAVPVSAGTKAAGNPIKIAVLADLQTGRAGRHEHRAVELALAEEPDLILMPGDLFHVSQPRWDDRQVGFRELVDRIEAPVGVFAVPGNVDVGSRLRPFLASSPIRYLENEVVTLRVRDTLIAIGGLKLDFTSPEAGEAIRRLAGTPADVRILLAHYPDAVHSTRSVEGIDLIVSGHTHGGQVVIPGFGPPMTLTSVPRRIAAGGLHEMFGRQIYVSRGIGMERGNAPPVRFFCSPEVSLLTLR
jgi:predicted MPP superfamily phosphohydrolase